MFDQYISDVVDDSINSYPASITHVVHFSGGIGSWATARIVKDEIMAPFDTLVLLFADTMIEDEDTYAFITAASIDLDTPITRIADGRTPWQVFKDKGFLANTRVDICSAVLKRDLLRKHIEDNYHPATTVNYLGIDWTEIHRLERARPRWVPWKVEAPLCATAYSKADLLAWADKRGLPRQRLYEMGMPHANCGGGCVKAGQGHFAKLLKQFPSRFNEWETNEQDVRQHLGKDVSILRDRTGGTTTPLTLTDLRLRIESKQVDQLDLFDFGGCGCAID